MVDVQGWTLPTYQWGVFKKGLSRLCRTTDSSNRSTPLWLVLASDLDSPQFAQRWDCTSKRILKRAMRRSQKKCYNQSFCDASIRPVICSHLPPDQTQAELPNKQPSIQWDSRSLGSRLWWKQPWHLMAVQEYMPNMSVIMIEEPNEDFIRCLSNIMDHVYVLRK